MRIEKRRDGSRNHALLKSRMGTFLFVVPANPDAVFFFFLPNNNHNIVRVIHLLLSHSHPHLFVKCIIADVSKFAKKNQK
jgi:hypothetical protein